MRTLLYIRYLLTIILPALCIASCGEDGDVAPASIPLPSDVEIVPQASLTATRGGDPDLSGAQDGTEFPVSTNRVFAVSAFLTDGNDGKFGIGKTVYAKKEDAEKELDNIQSHATVPYFLNQPIRTDEKGNFHFNTENGQRYFPEDGSHVYFYAFSPACAEQDATDKKKVTWTLTGREDIMYARDLRGIRKAHGSDLSITNQPQPDFHFEHLLVKINFNCRLGEGFPDGIRLTKISVSGPTKASLDLKTGILDCSLSSDNESEGYEIYPDHRIYASETFNYVCSILYPPGEYVRFKIEAVGAFSYDEVTMYASEFKISGTESGNSNFKTGYEYNINLIFEGTKLSVNPSVDPWEIVEESTNHEI